MANQFLDNALGARDGNGEPNALSVPVDSRIDTDQLALDVEQRPAGITRIDRGVGLDEVIVRATVGIERAVERAHYPGGDGMGQAKGVADGNHGLADH